MLSPSHTETDTILYSKVVTQCISRLITVSMANVIKILLSDKKHYRLTCGPIHADICRPTTETVVHRQHKTCKIVLRKTDDFNPNL